jgi:hypothetical protein
MAEVRAIPSAVGAFEAQVIDTTRAYNILLQNAAAERKQTLALRKEIEDNLNTSLSDKRIIRQQDASYINGLRDDLNNYFYQNKSAILAGGQALNELKRRQGLLTSEITRSVSIKENGVQLQSYALKTMDPLKKTDVSVGYKQALAAYELPMNDQRRMEYRFKNQNGEDVDVDQLTINELDRIAYFSPDKLDAAVSSIETNRFQTEWYDKKSGKDITRGFSSKSPFMIANTVLNTAIEYPDMNNFYLKASQAEQAMFAGTDQDLQTRMNITLKQMEPYYIKAGAATKEGFGSIMSLFEKDGVAGVDPNNPYEYALFQQLYANLPRDLGMSYDYKTQANYRARQSLQLQQNNAYLQSRLLNEAKSLDGLFIKHIKEGKFNGQEASAVVNAFLVAEDALGGIKPGTVVFDDKNKTMTVTTTKPLYNPDGSLVTSEGAAAAFKINGANVNPIPGGGFALTETKTFSIDKSNDAWQTNLVNGLNLAQSAIINDKVEKSFGSLRTKTGVNVLEELQR